MQGSGGALLATSSKTGCPQYCNEPLASHPHGTRHRHGLEPLASHPEYPGGIRESRLKNWLPTVLHRSSCEPQPDGVLEVTVSYRNQIHQRKRERICCKYPMLLRCQRASYTTGRCVGCLFCAFTFRFCHGKISSLRRGRVIL